MQKKKILVTGVLGFIFSNFIRLATKQYPEYKFVGIDKGVKNYNLHNMYESNNYKFYMADIADQHIMDNIFELEKPDIVIHGAAESFVDDSINDIKPFLHSNILGTQCLINACLKHNVERLIYTSTDEIFGHLKSTSELSWTENSFPHPRNPYSASKYAGELIIYAASETHGLKYNITRSCNNYGSRQPNRNLVPKIIYCLMNNKPIPIHGDGKNLREWLCVDDNCFAIMKIMESAPYNEVYNIGSGVELTNLEMIDKISNIMNKRPVIDFIKDRKGHDFRYSVNCDKLKLLGSKPAFTFDAGMKKCVQWYINNPWYFENMK